MSKVGAENFDDLMEIRLADIEGQSDYQRDDKLRKAALIRKYRDEILKEKNALTIKELDINGKDLMDAGYPKGPIVGEILRFLLDRVLEEPELNEKEKLLNLCKEEY